MPNFFNDMLIKYMYNSLLQLILSFIYYCRKGERYEAQNKINNDICNAAWWILWTIK